MSNRELLAAVAESGVEPPPGSNPQTVAILTALAFELTAAMVDSPQAVAAAAGGPSSSRGLPDGGLQLDPSAHGVLAVVRLNHAAQKFVVDMVRHVATQTNQIMQTSQDGMPDMVQHVERHLQQLVRPG